MDRLLASMEESNGAGKYVFGRKCRSTRYALLSFGLIPVHGYFGLSLTGCDCCNVETWRDTVLLCSVVHKGTPFDGSTDGYVAGESSVATIVSAAAIPMRPESPYFRHLAGSEAS
jgi:hypothetical protein